MLDAKHCKGCHNDIYNPGGRLHRNKCWYRESGKIVVRFETGTWTEPTEPKAFTEVRIPSCYKASGRHFSEKLPDCVKPEHVVWDPQLEHERARLRDLVATTRMRLHVISEECREALAVSGFSPSDLFTFEVNPELAAFARLPAEEDPALVGDDEEAE